MKSLARDSGQGLVGNQKQSTQDSAAKYWGTLHNTKVTIDAQGNYQQEPRKFKRSDGSMTVDKTKGWHSRPAHKETIRNANRAITKRARTILKRRMMEEIEHDL